MNKLQMAHEYAIALINSGSENMEFDKFISLCHNYADAMHAEHEKRKDKSLPEVLKDDFVIDWSQAPEGYIYYFVNSDNRCFWGGNEPIVSDLGVFIAKNYSLENVIFVEAPNFGYKGDWKQSLRKRPE